MSAPEVITAIWQPPFAGGPVVKRPLDASMTLAAMVTSMAGTLPGDFATRGTICIDGHETDNRYWHSIRVKPGRMVTFHYRLAGGQNGSRAIAALVIAIATVLIAPAIGGALVKAGYSATVGKLATAGVTVLGNLAARAIAASPGSPGNQADDQMAVSGPASISGNVLGPGADIPRVLGTRDIFPPLGTQPIVERVGEDEYAEAVFALAGPHLLENIRIDGAPIADAEDIDIETRGGGKSDTPITLVARYGAMASVNAELTGHDVDDDDAEKLADSANPGRSLPGWAPAATARRFDECWLHLVLPEGLSRLEAPDEVQTMPIRLRIKRAGTSDWINLPELHFAGKDVRQMKPTINLTFAAPPSTVPGLPGNRGFVAAYARVPGQADPATDGWQAHASFLTGTDAVTGIWQGVEGTSKVRRTVIEGPQATFYLDPALFERGAYDIEIKRGAVIAKVLWTPAAYTYGGEVLDLFHYRSGARAPRSRDGLADRAFLSRVVSVVNEHPVAGGRTGPGVALMAVRVKNRGLDRFAVRASGLMAVWDGTAFTGLAASSNPANQYNHVLTYDIAARPLPAELVDVASLAAWHAYNATHGHRCDLVVEGAVTDELLGRIAGCGYGQPRQSETWGVIIDRDRSADAPVQVFSERNSSGFSTSMPFARLPDAIRATYVDTSGTEDAAAEVIVYRKGRQGVVNPLIEEIRYEGVTDEAAVIKRATFDLAQVELRAASHSFNAPAEVLRCTRGDLIGYNGRMIASGHQAARIEALVIESGLLAGVTLDAPVNVYNEPDLAAVADVAAVADLAVIGRTTACLIRQANGDHVIRTVANATSVTCEIRFADPQPVSRDAAGRMPLGRGDLALLGQPGAITRRLIVTDIRPRADLSARVTCVAEAPQLHQGA